MDLGQDVGLLSQSKAQDQGATSCDQEKNAGRMIREHLLSENHLTKAEVEKVLSPDIQLQSSSQACHSQGGAMQSPRPCWVGREQTMDSARVCVPSVNTSRMKLIISCGKCGTAVAVEGSTQRGRTLERQETHVAPRDFASTLDVTSCSKREQYT